MTPGRKPLRALNRALLPIKRTPTPAPVRPPAAKDKTYPWRLSSDVIAGHYSLVRLRGKFNDRPRYEFHRDAAGNIVEFDEKADALAIAARLNARTL